MAAAAFCRITVGVLLVGSILVGQVLLEFLGQPGDRLGYRVAWVGDVNGDGRDEFIISAPHYNNWQGRACVYSSYGSILHTFVGTPGSLNNSPAGTGSQLGIAVSGAGDTNSDGVPDVIIGARNWNHGRGAARVYSGLDGSLIQDFYGPDPSAAWGDAVAGGGNIDGDAFDDFIVGGYHADVSWDDRGGVRVFSGIDGSQIHHFIGDDPGDEFGRWVDGGTDVNGDGSDDILVGIWENDDLAPHGGGVRVYSGSSGMVLFDVDGDQADAKLGFPVAWVGDVDADGTPDFMASAAWYDSSSTLIDSGRVYVYSGLNGGLLHVFDGDQPYDQLGYSADGAGDVDGDGYDDLAIGIPGSDEAGLDAGAVRIYSGCTGQILAAYHGGSNSHRFGHCIAAGGDSNGDRLIVGEPYYDLVVGLDDDYGRAYVLDLTFGVLYVTSAQPGGAGTPIYFTNGNLTPQREYYNIFSLDICSIGPGTGFLAGLCVVTPANVQFIWDQLLTPVGTIPFHFTAPSSYVNWGPFQVGPVTLDALCFDFTGGVLGPVSPVTRLTIQ